MGFLVYYHGKSRVALASLMQHFEHDYIALTLNNNHLVIA